MMYKCNDCGHVFLGSDFTTTCPECGSSNIEVQKSNNEVIVKIKDWIRNNKLLAIIISVIFLLIILPKGDEKLEIGNNINSNSDNVDFTYKLKFQPNGDHFSVFMINEENNKEEPYDANKFSWLNLNASIIGSNGLEYLVSITNNKIYYCSKGELTIRWTYSKKRLNSMWQSGFRTYNEEDFDLVSNSLNCIPLIKVNNVSADLCAKKIYINVFPKELSKEILVSINGKDGDYLVSKSRNIPSDISKFDVWIYHKDFKIPVPYLGDLPSLDDDGQCNKQLTESRKNQILTAFKNSNYEIIDDKIDWFKDDCKIIFNNQEYDIYTFSSVTETLDFRKKEQSISFSSSDIEMCGCEISKIKLN